MAATTTYKAKLTYPQVFLWRMSLFLILAILLFTTQGCVSMFTAKTTATYDGKTFTWESTKNQEGLDATLGKDKDGNPLATIKTTATTPEAAIAAAAAAQAKFMDAMAGLIQTLTGVAKAAATKGAVP